VKSIGVGDVDVDDAPRPVRVVWVIGDEVQLHWSALHETVLGWFVQFRHKTQSSVAGKSSIEVVHPDDRGDALENHLSHNREGRRCSPVS
jgi:hypothetical protein